jgi:hypothetical protein
MWRESIERPGCARDKPFDFQFFIVASRFYADFRLIDLGYVFVRPRLPPARRNPALEEPLM